MSAGDVGRLAVVTLAAAASIATPAPRYRYPRNYPVWQVESGGSWSYGCVAAEAWVSKSGKEGMGLTLKLTPTGASGCYVSIGGGGFTVAGREVTAGGCPLDVKVPPGGPSHLYLPFFFDNQKLWNEGHT